MRRLPAALIALLLLLGGVATAAPLEVPIDQFRPTQRAIGRASAMVHLDHWKSEAKRKGMSLKRYAKHVLEADLQSEAIPTVIDPQGHYRNTDAHHRITALLQLKNETGVTIKLRTKILADYRDRTEGEFANDFVGRLKKGYFGPRETGATPLAKMESLPKTFAGLKDDRLRSAVETAFARLGIDGKLFTDYVEFRVGEALVKQGLYARLRDKGLIEARKRSIPEDEVLDRHIAKQIVKMLRKPEMRQLLVANAKDRRSQQRIEAALDD